MSIERDQLFLQMHDVALIDSIEQQLQLLPDLTMTVDSTKVEMNLPQDVGNDDPYNLILLPINKNLRMVI
jgi:hypothetical protein